MTKSTEQTEAFVKTVLEERLAKCIAGRDRLKIRLDEITSMIKELQGVIGRSP